VENNKCACEKTRSPAHQERDPARTAESEIHAGSEIEPHARQPRPARKAPAPGPAKAKEAAQTRPAQDEHQQPRNPGTSQFDLSATQLLDSIYFAQNGSTLEGAIAQLEAVVSFAVQSDRKGSLLITGHADPREAAPYELALQRATAVHDFLVQHGVPRLRIKIQSLGDSQSSAGAPAQPGRNQRVEIRSLGR
jgi:outer membrane protein OmpA-like peptidoglycan-associated protein